MKVGEEKENLVEEKKVGECQRRTKNGKELKDEL